MYWDNYYGPRTDTLNSGLETDRMEIEWYFSDPQLTIISKIKSEIPNEFPCFDYTNSGTYEYNDLRNESFIGVCIPRDLVTLKQKDLALAIALRISFRKLAHTLITNDYTIIDVKSKVEPKSILIWTNKLRDFKKLKK